MERENALIRYALKFSSANREKKSDMIEGLFTDTVFFQ